MINTPIKLNKKKYSAFYLFEIASDAIPASLLKYVSVFRVLSVKREIYLSPDGNQQDLEQSIWRRSNEASARNHRKQWINMQMMVFCMRWNEKYPLSNSVWHWWVERSELSGDSNRLVLIRRGKRQLDAIEAALVRWCVKNNQNTSKLTLVIYLDLADVIKPLSIFHCFSFVEYSICLLSFYHLMVRLHMRKTQLVWWIIQLFFVWRGGLWRHGNCLINTKVVVLVALLKSDLRSKIPIPLKVIIAATLNVCFLLNFRINLERVFRYSIPQFACLSSPFRTHTILNKSLTSAMWFGMCVGSCDAVNLMHVTQCCHVFICSEESGEMELGMRTLMWLNVGWSINWFGVKSVGSSNRTQYDVAHVSLLRFRPKIDKLFNRLDSTRVESSVIYVISFEWLINCCPTHLNNVSSWNGD